MQNHSPRAVNTNISYFALLTRPARPDLEVQLSLNDDSDVVQQYR